MFSLQGFKKSLAGVPLLGTVALAGWRLFNDPYLGPIGEKVAAKLPRWKKQIIVQIGTNDGTRFDPVSALIKNRCLWKALFVEPIPMFFNKLLENFGKSPRFMYECAAVSNTAGNFSFYYLGAEARDAALNWQEYFDFVGSLDRTHVVNALAEEAVRLEKFIVEIQVPVITFSTLLAKWNIKHIDALVVDAEGYDWRIVKQAIDLGFQPEVILFEHSNLTPDERNEASHFLAVDYNIEDVGIDYLCIKRSRQIQQ